MSAAVALACLLVWSPQRLCAILAVVAAWCLVAAVADHVLDHVLEVGLPVSGLVLVAVGRGVAGLALVLGLLDLVPYSSDAVLQVGLPVSGLVLVAVGPGLAVCATVLGLIEQYYSY